LGESPITSQNFGLNCGSRESVKDRVRCGFRVRDFPFDRCETLRRPLGCQLAKAWILCFIGLPDQYESRVDLREKVALCIEQQRRRRETGA